MQPSVHTSKELVGGVGGDALASQFKLDFTLTACMGSIERGSEWYLYSSASYHTKGNKEFFSSVEETNLKLHI